MAKAVALTDHDRIRRWTEARGGRPAAVRATRGTRDPGVLRIDFPDVSSEDLEPIDWDDWFDKFEESALALLVQEEEEESRFNKLVSRDEAEG